MTFEDVLYDVLYDPTCCSKWTPRQARIVAEIEAKTGNATPPIVVRLEQEIRKHWGFDAVEPINWGQVGVSVTGKRAEAGAFNWANILAFIEQILPIILSLIPLL